MRGIEITTATKLGRKGILDDFTLIPLKHDAARENSRLAQVEESKSAEEQDTQCSASYSYLRELAFTLTAGKDWYGVPAKEKMLHAVDFATLLPRGSLVPSLSESAVGIQKKHLLEKKVTSVPGQSSCNRRNGTTPLHYEVPALRNWPKHDATWE